MVRDRHPHCGRLPRRRPSAPSSRRLLLRALSCLDCRAALALVLAARYQSRRDLRVSYDVRTPAVRSSRCGERNADRLISSPAAARSLVPRLVDC